MCHLRQQRFHVSQRLKTRTAATRLCSASWAGEPTPGIFLSKRSYTNLRARLTKLPKFFSSSLLLRSAKTAQDWRTGLHLQHRRHSSGDTSARRTSKLVPVEVRIRRLRPNRNQVVPPHLINSQKHKHRDTSLKFRR